MRFALGDATISPVAELDRWSFPTAEMFPGVGPGLHSCDRIDLTITTYLLRTPDGTVLVDAGNGNDKERPTLLAHHRFRTDYLARLGSVVAPEEVDFVVCTHLHPDHCGGLTRLVDGQWVPVFPNARHLISRQDHAWLEGLHAADPAEGIEADIARTFADSVAPVLDAGLVELVDLPREISAGVTLRPAPGHTAGHLVVEVERGGRHAVVCGDVLHHPLQFGDLSLAHAGDGEPDRAARSRTELCARLAETGGLLLPAHFAPGQIRRDGAGYRYTAVGAAPDA